MHAHINFVNFVESIFNTVLFNLSWNTFSFLTISVFKEIDVHNIKLIMSHNIHTQ